MRPVYLVEASGGHLHEDTESVKPVYELADWGAHPLRRVHTQCAFNPDWNSHWSNLDRMRIHRVHTTF